MIWDSNSSNMEEPIANEREWVMGFHTSTVIIYILKTINS